MDNQFYTFCKRCGRQILMTRAIAEGKWIPCDPNIKRFAPAGGPMTYINPQGKICHGRRDQHGSEFGYKKHSPYCVLDRRKAV